MLRWRGWGSITWALSFQDRCFPFLPMGSASHRLPPPVESLCYCLLHLLVNDNTPPAARPALEPLLARQLA